jgi:hypothetical protein
VELDFQWFKPRRASLTSDRMASEYEALFRLLMSGRAGNHRSCSARDVPIEFRQCLNTPQSGGGWASLGFMVAPYATKRVSARGGEPFNVWFDGNC